MMRMLGTVLAALVLAGLTACAPASRLGMVKDPQTGLMFGSAVDKILITDADLYPNKRLKLTLRNTSGDPAFDLRGFEGRLMQAFVAKGYQPADGEDWGIKIDVNVTHSGQIQESMASEYAFLGGAGGGLAGLRSDIKGHSTPGIGAAAGAISGATVGTVLGSYVTEDTYIILAAMTFSVRDKARKQRKVVSFDGSPRIEEIEESGYGKLRFSETIRVAAYAGGTVTGQAAIADQVRQRFVRIASDFF